MWSVDSQEFRKSITIRDRFKVGQFERWSPIDPSLRSIDAFLFSTLRVKSLNSMRFLCKFGNSSESKLDPSVNGQVSNDSKLHTNLVVKVSFSTKNSKTNVSL